MADSKYFHKRHNVTVLIYHLVWPAKYRRVIFSEEVDSSLKEICLEIEKRYELIFLEIGVDRDQAHFLVQSVPTYSPKKVVQRIKSITAKEIFRLHPEVKHQLWGGEFWGKGYFMSSVGKHGDEAMLKNYVKNQGSDESYQQLHQGQLKLL
jgi:REP element-mobilizing transposase RayT